MSELVEEYEAAQGIVPIEIRPGIFVRIHPIPHDLTCQEAEKIAFVVMAMVAQDTAIERLGDS